MDVVHLCTYYISNKLYKNLVEAIDNKNIEQYIYVPIRSEKHANKDLPVLSHGTIFYDHILTLSDKMLWLKKIKKQQNLLIKLIDFNSIKDHLMIHAHTLFSDGGTALGLHKKFKIPFHVAIRNTDINIYYRYGLPYRRRAHEILKAAEKIYFISEAYKNKTFNLLPLSIKADIEKKSIVIPNGATNSWFENLQIKKVSRKLTLAFTGSLNKNKNLETVLYVLKDLISKGLEAKLNVAGSGEKRRQKKLIKLCHELGLSNSVIFHGFLNESELIEMLDKSDIFVLPSLKETFGISYIEAMARGLPVIYTRNEGIDGFFDEGHIGFSIHPKNHKEISSRIFEIINNYEKISEACKRESQNFQWDKIASEYIHQYNFSKKKILETK